MLYFLSAISRNIKLLDHRHSSSMKFLGYIYTEIINLPQIEHPRQCLPSLAFLPITLELNVACLAALLSTQDL